MMAFAVAAREGRSEHDIRRNSIDNRSCYLCYLYSVQAVVSKQVTSKLLTFNVSGCKPERENMDERINIVTVRWWDGYLEEFECSEVRFGCDLLWMRLSNGQNRHIPLRQVRWYSLSKESHQRKEKHG